MDLTMYEHAFADPPLGVGNVCEALSKGSSKMQCGPGSMHGMTGNCAQWCNIT